MTTYESAFEEATCESLADLSAQFGFRKTCAKLLEVHFENEKVRLLVGQRHVWDQVVFAIGLIADREMYDLDTISAWKRVDGVPMQVGDENVLRRALAKAASLLIESARSLLVGKESEFAQLAAFRRSHDAAYNKRIRMDPILARANEAWTQHRYGDVVDALSSVAESLDPIEKMRLRLAAKYLESGRGKKVDRER